MSAFLAAVCSLLICVPLSENLQAQEGVGSVSGRVMDVRTGQYLSNTRVSVEGTSIQTLTNQFGEFTLTGVPTGTASVRAFYTGYFDSTQTIEISSDKTERLEFALRSRSSFESEEDVYELEVFEIASQYDAMAAAIHEQRFSQTNIAVVNAESMGNINEGNIGEFVKYLPGISINYVAADVRSIEVRGMGDLYTNVTVDGNSMASASSSTMNRTFELEQVSLNNVERVEVVKVPTPDMPANSLGGSVNLVSKSAFERDGREIRYNAYLSANSERLAFGKTPGPGNKETYKILPGIKLSYADVYQDGKLGLIVNYLNSNQFNSQHRSQMRWSFGDWTAGAANPQPVLRRYHLQDGPKFTNRQSLNVKVDYKLSENTFILSSIQWNDYLSAFRNTNVTWDTNVANSAQNQTNEPGVVLSAANKGSITYGGSWRDKYGDTWHGDLRLEHSIGDLKLQVGGYWSVATNRYRSFPKGHVESATMIWPTVDGRLRLSGFGGNDKLDITADVEHIDGAGTNNPGLGTSDLSVYRFDEISYDNFMNGEDKLYGFNADATWQLSGRTTGFLKAGAKFTSQERSSERFRTRYYYVGQDGKKASADDFVSAQFLNDDYAFEDPSYGIAPVLAWPDFSKVKKYYAANTNLFTLRGVDGDGINDIIEDITALYAMGSIDLFNKRAAVTGGVRWEQTDLKAKGNRDNKWINTDYNGFYPNLALRWDITDHLVGRIAYGRTIGRQNFSQLIPNANITYSDDQQEGSVTVNNIGLDPLDADTLDLSLEYYTESGGVFSVGFFNKELQNYIRTIGRLVTQEDIDSYGLPSDTLGFDFTTQENAGDATVNGVEFNISQKLGFLPAWLGEVSVFGNGTFLDVEGNFGGDTTVSDLAGFVKDTWNYGVAVQKGGLLANLKFTHKGKELIGPYTSEGASAIGDVNHFNAKLDQLDFDLEYRFSRRYTVYFSARNMLNNPQNRIYQSKSANLNLISQSEEYGVQFSLGVKGQF